LRPNRGEQAEGKCNAKPAKERRGGDCESGAGHGTKR
jgi:hypothetical protein